MKKGKTEVVFTVTYKPIIPLGNGETVIQELSHFIHKLGNQITVLRLSAELKEINRNERHARRGQHGKSNVG